MHFTTQDGYTFSSHGTCNGYDSRWVDAQVTIKRETRDETLHVLTLPLYGDRWIHPSDARKIDALLGEGASDALCKVNITRLLSNPDQAYWEVNLPSLSEGESITLEYRFEDLSFSDMCDGVEPFLGAFAKDDLQEYAWTEEADNGDLIVHWDLNQCDGSEIVARYYPEFDCESEAIFDECDGNLSATYKRFDHQTVLIHRLFGAITTVIEMQTTSPLGAK